MAEPHEASHSLQPPRPRHASGAGNGGPPSRRSVSSAGSSSVASATTHVDADTHTHPEQATTTSTSHTHNRPSPTSPTHHARHEPEPPRPPRAGHRGTHRHNRSSSAFLLNDPLSGGWTGHDAGHGDAAQTRARSSGRREAQGSDRDRDRDRNRDRDRERGRDRDQERDRARSSSRGANTMLAVPQTPEKRRREPSAEATLENRRTRKAAAPSAPTAAAAPTPASRPATSTSQPANQSLDIDSAQIVNMALNLSESRRMVFQRSVSQQLPPRLAPAPDSAVGGSLLRQLQQQRRISRTLSPNTGSRSDRPPGSRAVSGPSPTSTSTGTSTGAGTSPRVGYGGTLQPAFDRLGDGSSDGFRFLFSPSTLARAQKAKNYLELLGQQRRLLELIPPLTPEATPTTAKGRSASLSSPPTASSTSSQPFSGPGSSSGDAAASPVRLGRAYNPLQYIRNRKVRVRERKTIDGQAQGFGDVAKAAEWVDEVAKWAATGQSRTPGGPVLPSFASADALTAAMQASATPGSRSAGQGGLPKPKRPRVDWVIDPADMLADVYWLEQGDNKMLVEDRHWRRVFPQDPSLYRPASQRVVDESASPNSSLAFSSSTQVLDPSTGQPLPDSPETGDADGDRGSTRQRARQKLNELRSYHHRHGSSFQNHDVYKLRRGSFSDTSDSDMERRLPDRRTMDGAGTGNNADRPFTSRLRNKAAPDGGAEKDGKATSLPTLLGDPKTQARLTSVGSMSGNGNGQTGAFVPAKAESAMKTSTTVPMPPAPGVVNTPPRPGLDIQSGGRRWSVDYDSSRQTSPELRPATKESTVPSFVLGSDLSPPPSRATSPPSSRFRKVKHMFRDHSHERERERERTNSSGFDRGSQERDDLLLASSAFTHTQLQPQPLSQQDIAENQSAPITETPSVGGEMNKMTTSTSTKSLSRSHTNTSDGHARGSGAGGLNRHRTDESGGSGSTTSTLRGIFKNGPRFDTMLRSGVSKVSDMFWRRDGSEPLYEGAEPDESGSSSSSDDSDGGELTLRGRSRKTARYSRSQSMATDWPDKAATTQTQTAAKPGEKHYLDVMPTFGGGGGGGQGQKSQSHLSPSPGPLSRPSSRRSARFDRLKPRRIDVGDSSFPGGHGTGDTSLLQPAGYPYSQRAGTMLDSDMSESEPSRSRRVSNAAGHVLPSVEEPPSPPPTAERKLSVPASSDGGGFAKSGHRSWSISQPAYRNNEGSLSRRELARRRASLYSSAVLARELARRANEPRVRRKVVARGDSEVLTWPALAAYSTNNAAELARRPVRHVELYPLAAQVLSSAILRSGRSWQVSAEQFSTTTMPALRGRLDTLRSRVAGDLSSLARKAADEADLVSQDLVAVQRLHVIQVEDTIEQMLRRRRRRFRWVRRAGWLTVEWMLVGFMWFVWLVVMIARVLFGTYQGVVTGVRWLLWL